MNASLATKILCAISLFALSVGTNGEAIAQCPASTITCKLTKNSPPGEVVAFENLTSLDPIRSVSCNESGASYNLRDGVIIAAANSDYELAHEAAVIATDLFELHNIPATFLTVRLNISMLWVSDPSGRMAWAGGSARLTVGDQVVEIAEHHAFTVPFIEIDTVVGEGFPFSVTYETDAWAYGYAPVAVTTCQLEFIGLPDGAEITSCNGFGTTTVPVEETTWGNLKALYD